MIGWHGIVGRLTLYRLAAVAVAGHRFWLLPMLPLAWLLVLAAGSLLEVWLEPFEPKDAQGVLIGLPTTVLAIFLGVRIIAGEIDGRSLEIAYTVPGGCVRLWWAKLAGTVLMLAFAEVLLAVFVALFFTGFPPAALYGALQPAVFYLVLAMGMATLFRSEVAGALAAAAILGLNGLITDGGDHQIRISPFWNPLAVGSGNPAEILAWTVQNRIGIALLTAGLLALAFMRANRRERMLDS